MKKADNSSVPAVIKSPTTSGSQPSAMTSSSSSDVAMETDKSERPEVVGSKESRTVFVSNLAMAVTEERLREVFSKVSSWYIHLIS